jgi:hypothetical protein
MINEVRNTVLYIINKDNNGYISPEQFNLYADNAQKEIFEGYFHDYSRAVNKRNVHGHTSGYGDIPRRLEEVIDLFTKTDILTFAGITLTFSKPTDAYQMGTVLLSDGATEVEYVSHNKMVYLNGSLDVAPTLEYPAYTLSEAGLKVYPTTINTTGSVIANYIRYPKVPKWTYNSISGGEPFFNPALNGYQDFELPESDKMNLIVKILQYAGVEIREPEVVQIAKTEEVQQKQEHN